MDKSKRAKRHQLLVYPAFQLKVLLINGFVMLAVAVAVAFFVHRSFADLWSQGVAAHLSSQDSYFTFMLYQEKLVMSYLATGLVSGLLLSSAAILLLSHRVAGPIVRLTRYLSAVQSEPDALREPLTFRKGDFFLELPGVVNGALKASSEFHSKKAS